MTTREEMLETIRRYGVVDERVLAVLAGVDRAKFIAKEWKGVAYEDRPIPIGHEQTISQPYTVARMIELLVQSAKFIVQSSKVLEIGTGSGWQTGILAKLFAQVYSVEVIPELAERAGEILGKLKVQNAKLKVGDGKEGWRDFAPYDGIICGANAQEAPRAWVQQLSEGGRIVVPVQEVMTRGTKVKGEMKWESFEKYLFVPLV